MNRHHRRLINLMASVDPVFLAGSFATVFPASSSHEGERGTFRYFEGGYWDIRTDGGPTFQLTPNGSRIIRANGTVEDGPAMTNPPRRPPWSLVLPRHSTFLGRPEDDWQLDPGWPATVDDGSWIVPLTSLGAPGFKGTLTLDSSLYVITRAQLGAVVQTLSIDRTASAEEDLAVLESLKSAVKYL